MTRGYLFLTILISPFAAYAQGFTDETGWFSVPTDKSALVIVSYYEKAQSLVLLSAKQETLDKLEWSYDHRPLVRQYRMPPGEYKIFLGENTDKSLKVTLGAGDMTYLIFDKRNSENQVSLLSLPFTQYDQAKEIVGYFTEIKKQEIIAPKTLELPDNAIYLNTEPPFQIPKPEPPPK